MQIKTFKNKLKNRHFLSLAGNFSMAVLGFITYSIIFRAMSKTEAGNWVFFQFIFLLADTLRTGFIHSALIKFYSGAGQSGKRYSGAGWVIGVIVTLILLVVNFLGWIIFHNQLDETWSITLLYISIPFIAILPLNFSSWMQQTQNRFDRILFIRLMNQGGFILFIVILVYFKQLNFLNLLYVYILSCVITSILCLFFGWSHFKHIYMAKRESLIIFFNYAKYSTGATISSNLLKTSDAFLIKAFLGAETLAVYNLPQKLLEVIEIPLRSFIMTAMPEMSKKINEDGTQAAAPVMMRYVGILTLLLIPVSIIAIVFANLAIWLVGGDKYVMSDAPGVFQIFMLLAVFFPIDRFLGITLDIINKPKLNFIKVILMLFVQIAGGVIALYFFKSIYAVAFISILTFSAGVVFGHLSLRKYLKYSFTDIIKYGIAEFIRVWKLITIKAKLN